MRSWNHRGPLSLLLWPVSVLYRLLAAANQQLYRRGLRTIESVATPVIVVGNVVAGGAGKTPVVMALVRHLQERGHRPGVVSRGYGRHSSDCRAVLDKSTAREVGDEPLLIRQSTGAPVFVAARRAQAAQALAKRFPEVDIVVCDDGLQHHSLRRDIEICVFDERGIGNGFLLPAGPLREAWPRPIDLVLTAAGSRGVDGFGMQRELASQVRRADGTQCALLQLQLQHEQSGVPLWAVAGVARPESFFAMLRAVGLRLARTVALSDHADFTAAEWSGTQGQTLLCTEKDATKLWQHRPDAWAVPLKLEIDAEFWPRFDALVDTALRSKLSSAYGDATS
ncbi:MAG: tetraacyldisaccharide 4'-kinase [Burkholderiaceae bacterium]